MPGSEGYRQLLKIFSDVDSITTFNNAYQLHFLPSEDEDYGSRESNKELIDLQTLNMRLDRFKRALETSTGISIPARVKSDKQQGFLVFELNEKLIESPDVIEFLKIYAENIDRSLSSGFFSSGADYRTKDDRQERATAALEALNALGQVSWMREVNGGVERLATDKPVKNPVEVLTALNFYLDDQTIRIPPSSAPTRISLPLSLLSWKNVGKLEDLQKKDMKLKSSLEDGLRKADPIFDQDWAPE